MVEFKIGDRLFRCDGHVVQAGVKNPFVDSEISWLTYIPTLEQMETGRVPEWFETLKPQYYEIAKAYRAASIKHPVDIY
jgi:hypothetical protein